MKEFGAALRKAREAVGLTIKDLHERTRINPKYLEEIELGNFPHLPETYIRAFIKDYAREVGLDEVHVVESYNRLAEALKGITPPSPPVDTTALIPHADDTIEIIIPEKFTPQPADVITESEFQTRIEFTPPVTKIELDVDQLKLAERIRTQESVKKVLPTTPPPVARQQEELSKEKPQPPIQKIGEEKEASTRTRTEESAPIKKEFLSLILSTDESESHEKKKPKVKPGRPTRVYDTKPIPPSELPDYGGTVHPATKPPQPQRSHGSFDVQRRSRIAAWLIILILAVAIIAIIKFGGRQEQITGQKPDSTRISAQMEAKKFIDSSQTLIPEPQVYQEDTTTQPIPKEEKTLEPVKQIFAEEDSLVLEAFSNGAVWFSIRMDTTRSERGSMNSNEHRLWKAKDRFVVTLGDAGAISFMLNGKNIGTLGEDGAVLKNQLITRELLTKNQ